MTESRNRALQEIARRARIGQPVTFWLRDDDAVVPTTALDRLLALADRLALPLLLAVIPAPAGDSPTGKALVERLAHCAGVDIAVHGWSHQSHARAGEKKQELDPWRPASDVHDELRRGLVHLQALHGARVLPLLVPPWNRIAAGLLPGLGADGYTALSTYGPVRPVAGLKQLNSTLDIMNWKGGRVGHSASALWDMLAARLSAGDTRIGLLSHHLVHDETVWEALAEVLEAVAGAGAQWESARQILSVMPE